MPKPSAPVYRTTNWPEYNAALKRRGSLEIWFDPELALALDALRSSWLWIGVETEPHRTRTQVLVFEIKT